MQKVKNWSPVWIFPIVTALIGAWILFYHYSHQGPEVTLITTNAEGIEGGKNRIKSRSVDVGVVESATLTDDLTHVEIKARLNSGMQKLLHKRFRLLGGKAAGWARGSAVLGHCCPGPILNCSRERKVRCQRSIRYWILRRWPRRMPRGSVFCWKAARRASCRRAIRCCSAAIAWGQWKPAPSTRETSYNLPAVHQCAERSPGDHQRSFLERQRDRCRFDLGGDARRDGLAVDAVWRRVSFDIPEGLDLGQAGGE